MGETLHRLRLLGLQRVHFVGIGGIGMSALAELLLQARCSVSGSDMSENRETRRLAKLGAKIFIGHRREQVSGVEAVVYSSAIAENNPERLASSDQGIPQLSRGELLSRMSAPFELVTIAGTHGKTTTTGMISQILLAAGLDPTIAVGAHLGVLASNARLGGGSLFVAEADESDRSFLLLNPTWAVVTNIDTDHLDEYHTIEALEKAFLEHLENLKPSGKAIICGDDPRLSRLQKNIHRQVLTYGLSHEWDACALDLDSKGTGSEYSCFYRGKRLGRILLAVPGRHNVLNSLAAVLVGLQLGVSFRSLQGALADFKGADRRFQMKGERAGVWVIDDYAHHPTEIRATLDACQQLGRPMSVVFQPHRYSRTSSLMEELASCLQGVERLHLMEIYPAGEKPMPGVTSARLGESIGQSQKVHLHSNSKSVLEALRQELASGDVLLTIGAGDVWKIGDRFLNG